jgi:hypothetical protein
LTSSRKSAGHVHACIRWGRSSLDTLSGVYSSDRLPPFYNLVSLTNVILLVYLLAELPTYFFSSLSSGYGWVSVSNRSVPLLVRPSVNGIFSSPSNGLYLGWGPSLGVDERRQVPTVSAPPLPLTRVVVLLFTLRALYVSSSHQHSYFFHYLFNIIQFLYNINYGVISFGVPFRIIWEFLSIWCIGSFLGTCLGVFLGVLYCDRVDTAGFVFCWLWLPSGQICLILRLWYGCALCGASQYSLWSRNWHNLVRGHWWLRFFILSLITGLGGRSFHRISLVVVRVLVFWSRALRFCHPLSSLLRMCSFQRILGRFWVPYLSFYISFSVDISLVFLPGGKKCVPATRARIQKILRSPEGLSTKLK